MLAANKSSKLTSHMPCLRTNMLATIKSSQRTSHSFCVRTTILAITKSSKRASRSSCLRTNHSCNQHELNSYISKLLLCEINHSCNHQEPEDLHLTALLTIYHSCSHQELKKRTCFRTNLACNLLLSNQLMHLKAAAFEQPFLHKCIYRQLKA